VLYVLESPDNDYTRPTGHDAAERQRERNGGMNERTLCDSMNPQAHEVMPYFRD
jgi:hypothetical protein